MYIHLFSVQGYIIIIVGVGIRTFFLSFYRFYVFFYLLSFFNLFFLIFWCELYPDGYIAGIQSFENLPSKFVLNTQS